jgi:hypothetical protein
MRVDVMVRVFSASLFAGLALAASPAGAGDIDVRYRITLAGLSIGTAELSGNVTPQAYAVSMRASLTGLAGAVTSGRGAASVRGAISGTRTLSTGYALQAANSTMNRTIQIAMSGGNAGRVAIDPPFDPRPDRVPVTEAHRRGVTDPVSALVMPALPGDMLSSAQCNRQLEVFDGVQRFTISLSYGGMQTINNGRGGYVGQALVCNARYRPIAGHRPIPATDFMIANRDMSVWLVPAEQARVLLPYRIAVKTQVGLALIEADRFEGATGEATASITPRR